MSTSEPAGETNADNLRDQSQSPETQAPNYWTEDRMYEDCDFVAVLDSLVAYLRQYLVCDDHQFTILALWIVHTFTFQEFPTAACLDIYSPEPQCGKTRCLELLNQLCASASFVEVVARFDPGAPLRPEIAAARNSLNGIVPDWIAEFANETPHNLPPNLTAHQQDCAEPLLHIANAIGGPWPERARAAIVAVLALCESSCSLQMLEDVRECFQLKQNPEYLVTRDLLTLLSNCENRPWSAWPRNSGRRLGALLQPFGIKSHTIKAEALKGYRFCDFKDAWERYLAPLTSLAEASSEPVLGNVSKTASAPTSVTGNSMNGEELQAG